MVFEPSTGMGIQRLGWGWKKLETAWNWKGWTQHQEISLKDFVDFSNFPSLSAYCLITYPYLSPISPIILYVLSLLINLIRAAVAACHLPSPSSRGGSSPWCNICGSMQCLCSLDDWGVQLGMMWESSRSWSPWLFGTKWMVLVKWKKSANQ